MSPIRHWRDIVIARKVGGCGGDTRLRLLIEALAQDDVVETTLTEPTPTDGWMLADPAALDATFRRIGERLPPSIRGQLAVEAGRIRTGYPDSPAEPHPVDYVLAHCQGRVIECGTAMDAQAPPPWTGFASGPPASLDARTPIALGPSAVMTFTGSLLDDADRCAPLLEEACAALQLVDTGRSAYPLQHYPMSASGALRGDILWTRERAREAPPGPLIDFILFQVMTQPQRWMFPHSSLRDRPSRNLEVRHERTVAPSARYLLLDTLAARSDCMLDDTEWVAGCTLEDPRRGRIFLGAQLRFRIRPAALLASVVAALDPPRLAFAEHPILGEIAGQAAPLALSLCLGDLDYSWDPGAGG